MYTISNFLEKSYYHPVQCVLSTSEGYLEYIGGCSVHHEYIGRDIMIHTGGYHEYIGGVQYIGGISGVHRGIFSTSEGYHDAINQSINQSKQFIS